MASREDDRRSIDGQDGQTGSNRAKRSVSERSVVGKECIWKKYSWKEYRKSAKGSPFDYIGDDLETTAESPTEAFYTGA